MDVQERLKENVHIIQVDFCNIMENRGQQTAPTISDNTNENSSGSGPIALKLDKHCERLG